MFGIWADSERSEGMGTRGGVARNGRITTAVEGLRRMRVDIREELPVRFALPTNTARPDKRSYRPERPQARWWRKAEANPCRCAHTAHGNPDGHAAGRDHLGDAIQNQNLREAQQLRGQWGRPRARTGAVACDRGGSTSTTGGPAPITLHTRRVHARVGVRRVSATCTRTPILRQPMRANPWRILWNGISLDIEHLPVTPNRPQAGPPCVGKVDPPRSPHTYGVRGGARECVVCYASHAPCILRRHTPRILCVFFGYCRIGQVAGLDSGIAS